MARLCGRIRSVGGGRSCGQGPGPEGACGGATMTGVEYSTELPFRVSWHLDFDSLLSGIGQEDFERGDRGIESLVDSAFRSGRVHVQSVPGSGKSSFFLRLVSLINESREASA